MCVMMLLCHLSLCHRHLCLLCDNGSASVCAQASTSELYGKVQEIPQKETTPFYPRSPYGELVSDCLYVIVA